MKDSIAIIANRCYNIASNIEELVKYKDLNLTEADDIILYVSQ